MYLFLIWTVDEGKSPAASASLFTLGKGSAASFEWHASGTQQLVWTPRKRKNFLLLLVVAS
jgi:hypothetical protein